MHLKIENVGFIGAGNMATALINGLIQGGTYAPEQILASDKNSDALKKVQELGIKGFTQNVEVVRHSATVVFSVKPQNISEVLEEVKGEIWSDHLGISIVAGVPLKMIRSLLGQSVPLIRVMPNTPALVRQGVSALAGGDLVTPEHMDTAKNIFGAVGETVVVEEAMMDAVTALSGSGPGYVFRMMECMVKAGTAVGLDSNLCRQLVVQTFLGAAQLAKTSENPLARLREMVTSPGGTTEAGLDVFARMGLEDMVRKAVYAAWKRSVELGNKN